MEFLVDFLAFVYLVEGVTELLPGSLKLLPECETVEHDCVPLILEGLEDGGDTGCTGRLGLDQGGGLDLNELVQSEGLPVDGVHSILLYVLLDQPSLVNLPRHGGHYGRIGHLGKGRI